MGHLQPTNGKAPTTGWSPDELLRFHIRALAPEGLTPYDFQTEGAKHLVQRKKALLADEQGLGKTIQAILAARSANKWPVIIVCPAIAKLNWKREIETWDRGKCSQVQVLNGRRPTTIHSDTCWVILNYDILAYQLPSLVHAKPAMVIFDESQNMKNPSAKRSKAALALAIVAEYVFCLSGTPIYAKPKELWTTIQALGWTRYFNGTFASYARRYCGAYSWQGRLIADKASNLPELRGLLLKHGMLRRLKADVLEDLPKKRRLKYHLDDLDLKDYEQVEKEYLHWLNQKKIEEGGSVKKILKKYRGDILGVLGKMRRKVGLAKADAAVEWAKAHLVSTGRPLVMFAHHRDVIKILTEALKEYGVSIVHGGIPMEKRQDGIDKFNAGENLVFVGQTRAAGVAITLTAASDAVVVELDWTPAVLYQAEDRIHRIGQERDCSIWYLTATGAAIEEKMSKMIEAKAKVVAAVIGGEDFEPQEDNVRSLVEWGLSKIAG